MLKNGYFSELTLLLLGRLHNGFKAMENFSKNFRVVFGTHPITNAGGEKRHHTHHHCKVATRHFCDGAILAAFQGFHGLKK
jgi:hypothetical protein